MADNKKIAVESRDVLPVFPTRVWKSQLKPEDAERVNNKIKKKLNELTAGEPKLSSGKTWQTEQQLRHFETAELFAGDVFRRYAIEKRYPRKCFSNI